MKAEGQYRICPWDALESIPGLTAVMALWRARLGDWHTEFKNAFLQPAPDLAHSYPCPNDCGCWHEVIHHGPDDIAAVCRCDPCRCAPFALTPDEVRLWGFSWSRFSRALCVALELNFKFADVGLFHTRQIGSWAVGAVPVILTIQHDAGQFHRVVEALVARLRQPFILLAPTAQHLGAAGQELLAGVNAGFFGLDSHARFSADGGLQAVRRPGELFARFTPEPSEALEEGAARQAFALVKALDAAQPARKASLYTVFRLYCVEGLTVEQVARQCRCARSLVFLRLGVLRQKLGGDPRQLRQYSSHFERIEDSLAEPRARRINRQRSIYGEPAESQAEP